MNLVDTGLSARLNNNAPFPKVQKPEILGCFSVNTERIYEDTAKNFRYFRMPNNFPLNLNTGYGLEINKQVLDEGLECIFKYIFHHQDEYLSKSSLPQSSGVGEFDFICFRGLLRMLMCSPYESTEDWCIHATRYKGNIYLNQKDTSKKEHDRLSVEDSVKKICYYGFKFEQYCMTKDPAKEPNTSLPVDTCEQFYCMYKGNIQGMKLLFGAEVDGALCSTVCDNVKSKEVLNSLKMVELKCSIEPISQRQLDSYYRYKCRNWWCQSFLVGIKDLMVGCRDVKGHVRKIWHIDVPSLPKLSVNYWNPSECVGFLVKFLQMVRKLMKDVNCPYTVYEYYFNAQTKRIMYRVYRSKSEHTILPDWYIKMVEQRCN